MEKITPITTSPLGVFAYISMKWRDINRSYGLTNVLIHIIFCPFVSANGIPRDMIITSQVKLFFKII